MTSTFANALARALPSVGRSCQLRLPVFRQTRAFSSTPRTLNSNENSREKTREIERQLLNAQPEKAAKDNSPVSAIASMMRADKNSVSAEYSKMAESLEAEMLKSPYRDVAPPHYLHIVTHRHNTILTLTRPNGNPLISMGCGHLGFRKSGRSGYDPAYQLASHVFAQIQERGLLLDIKRLDVIFRGFGPGREAVTKVLLGSEGRNIRGLVSRVADSTRIKFGGTRSRKVRRLG